MFNRQRAMFKFTFAFCFLICLFLPKFSNLSAEYKLREFGLRFDPLIYADFFSPNGDGHNDTFFIANLDEYPINKIHIFNRWGDKVFEAEPYLNDWDGTVNIKNQFLGNAVPEGTYFYRFEYTVGDFITRKNGKILLKR